MRSWLKMCRKYRKKFRQLMVSTLLVDSSVAQLPAQDQRVKLFKQNWGPDRKEGREWREEFIYFVPIPSQGTCKA